MDFCDAGNEYLFEFDLPGLNRARIQISMDRDALLLVGTRMSPQPGGRSLRDERPVGAFVRRLVLPPYSCGDEIYATIQEGVLQLHIPKGTPYKEKGDSHTIQSEEPDYEYTHR
jgi:HSP20 family protein